MLRFKDMFPMGIEYRPGEDELTNYRAIRRHRGVYSTGEGGPIGEANDPSNENPISNYIDKGKHSKNVGPGYKTKNVKIKNQDGTHTIMVHQLASESTEVDEALSVQSRLKKGRDMRRNKAKIALGRARASRKFASNKTLQKRARRSAYKATYNKLVKNVPASELTPQRKAEIEKRLNTPAFKTRIDRMSKKMIKDVRKKEMDRKRAK